MVRWAALLAVLIGCAAARAQPERFILDEQGNWIPAPETAIAPEQAELERARGLLAEDKPGEAIKLLNAWLKANERGESPWLPEAYVLRGDARTALGNEYKALYDYEEVALRYAGTDAFVRALERELEIALRYTGGLKRKWWGMRVADARLVGEELLVRVQERLPGSLLAERAAMELADYYYRSRDLAMASEMYGIYLTNFPGGQHRQRAMERRIFASIGTFKGPRYDGSGLIESRVLIDEYAARYPQEAQRLGLDDALAARIDESAAEQMLEAGRWYLRRGDAPSARVTLRRLVTDYPRSVAASRAIDIMTEHQWIVPAASSEPVESVVEPASEPGGEAPR